MPFDFQGSYDELNPDDEDHRFYANLARDRGVRAAVDLGCGTGALARRLAAQGVDVIGVDPDPEMLRVARSREQPGRSAGRAEWRLGHSDVLPTGSADLALMTGHVAQVFTDEGSWHAALGDLRRALAPTGTLAFESRNPAARGWEGWTRDRTLRTIRTAEGDTEFWHETVSVEPPLVTYDTFTRNLRTQEQQVNREVLAFRDVDGLRSSLGRAGFEIAELHGDWNGRPVGPAAPELVVIASCV